MGVTLHYRLPSHAFRMQPARGTVIHRTGKWGMGPEIHGELISLSQDRAGVLWPREEAVGSQLELRFRDHSSPREFHVNCRVRQAKALEDGRVELIVDFDKRIPYLFILNLARPRLL